MLTLVFVPYKPKGFIVSVEEIPGLVARGDSFIEALNNILLEIDLFQLSNHTITSPAQPTLKLALSTLDHLN